MSDSANAFRAGLVIVAGTIIAIAFFFASKKTSLDERNSIPYYALLTDASGVNAKSLITVAGLQVGEIKNITLVGVTIGELIPDLELRTLDAIGFPPPSPDVRIAHNEDFDGIIGSLVDQGKLPGREAVERKKITKEEALAAILKVKGETVRVARVDFNVTNTVRIPTDTWMKKESLGVLGAKALFLELGPSIDVLQAGDRIVNVRSLTGTDALLAQAQNIVSDVRSITNKLDQDIGGITSDIKGITGELNRFVAGDGDTMPLDELYKLVMTDLRKLSNTVEAAVRDANKLIRDNDGEIAKLLVNVQNITSDIADLTGRGDPTAVGPDGGPTEEGDIRATMASIRKVADDLSSVTGQLREMLGENEEEVGQGIKSLQTTINELNRSLASLSEVAGRVERGEGTVGRLLTDEKIADKVEAAVAGASDFVTSITSLETHIDIGSWYNFYRGANTTTVGLKLQPRPDKFYLIEVVDDGGRLERFTERDRDGNILRESIREEDNQLRFSAMFAKQFFDFLVLRVGLIETTGGVGANIFFFDRRVELRSDVFDIRGPRNSLATDVLPDLYLPRWRTLVKAQPIPHLYVSAGIDDVLNSFGPAGFQTYSDQLGYGFDYFLGVGLTFKDDDLRSILPFIPGG
jgi:phospholipid/cholesterol/gamma-HCH transport system substrate-binding protein